MAECLLRMGTVTQRTYASTVQQYRLNPNSWWLTKEAWNSQERISESCGMIKALEGNKEAVECIHGHKFAMFQRSTPFLLRAIVFGQNAPNITSLHSVWEQVWESSQSFLISVSGTPILFWANTLSNNLYSIKIIQHVWQHQARFLQKVIKQKYHHFSHHYPETMNVLTGNLLVNVVLVIHNGIASLNEYSTTAGKAFQTFQSVVHYFQSHSHLCYSGFLLFLVFASS